MPGSKDEMMLQSRAGTDQCRQAWHHLGIGAGRESFVAGGCCPEMVSPGSQVRCLRILVAEDPS